MGIDLVRRQLAQHREQGKITGADGRGYARRSTKAKRSVADGWVSAGAPLVLEMFSSSQLEWFDGEEAPERWAEVRPYVVSAEPTTKQLGKHERWNAGLWEDEEGRQLVYLTVLLTRPCHRSDRQSTLLRRPSRGGRRRRAPIVCPTGCRPDLATRNRRPKVSAEHQLPTLRRPSLPASPRRAGVVVRGPLAAEVAHRLAE